VHTSNKQQATGDSRQATVTATTIHKNTTIQCGSHEINLRKINFNL